MPSSPPSSRHVDFKPSKSAWVSANTSCYSRGGGADGSLPECRRFATLSGSPRTATRSRGARHGAQTLRRSLAHPKWRSTKMLPGRLSSEAFALALLVTLAACADHGVVNQGPPPTATLAVSANLSGTAVTMVVVDVTAPDIPTMLVFNIPVVDGVASGSITIPAGSNRTITMRAYDAGGVQTHEGSATLNVQAGTNATISLTLTPLTGDLPITVTLGSFTVAVTPSLNTLANKATVQLTAAITDWNGNPTSGTVSWATDNPGIA